MLKSYKKLVLHKTFAKVCMYIYFVTNYLQKFFTDLTLQFLKNNNFFNYTLHIKTIILVCRIEPRYHETRKKTVPESSKNTTHCPAM